MQKFSQRMINKYDINFLTSLILNDEDSCMPSSINQYFGRFLFNSIEDYFTKQLHNLEKNKKAKYNKTSRYDPFLSKMLKFDNKTLKFRYIFNTNQMKNNNQGL